MASEVDILNLALARLGDNATVASIDPPEGSAQAEHGARFYPIARDSLLEMHPWGFATRRVVLAPLVTDTWNYQHAYASPADVITLLSVLPATAPNDDQSTIFETMADGVILTDEENATLRYVARITDTTKFPPLFVDALGWLLAAYLAGPVIKGDTGAQMGRAMMQSFMAALSAARASDSNQRHTRPTHTVPWLAGREGLPSPWGWK